LTKSTNGMDQNVYVRQIHHPNSSIIPLDPIVLAVLQAKRSFFT